MNIHVKAVFLTVCILSGISVWVSSLSVLLVILHVPEDKFDAFFIVAASASFLIGAIYYLVLDALVRRRQREEKSNG